jgi:transcriptional regulator with XRE-family HTH domain
MVSAAGVRAAGAAQPARRFSSDVGAALKMRSRPLVGRVERGEINISLINIVRPAEALEVEAGELFRAWSSDKG